MGQWMAWVLTPKHGKTQNAPELARGEPPLADAAAAGRLARTVAYDVGHPAVGRLGWAQDAGVDDDGGGAAAAGGAGPLEEARGRRAPPVGGRKRRQARGGSSPRSPRAGGGVARPALLAPSPAIARQRI